MPEFAPLPAARARPVRAVRRLLRIEDAWLLRQIGSRQPALWLRPQPLGTSAGQGIIALRSVGAAVLHGDLRVHADAWPWPDDSLPAIVLQHVLEGGPRQDALLDEAARVLAPEGRLFLLRFDRCSPWFWRYGRSLARRAGGRALSLPLNLSGLHRQALALEYRHALGPRGFRADAETLPAGRRLPERWPFASGFRATRIWVLRKRRQRLILLGRRESARAGVRSGYGLAAGARRQEGDAA